MQPPPRPPIVVVSQPMYFPWVGMLEQIRYANTFVFYDDVQFARGFFNRVQVKTATGMRWMTVPLRAQRRGQLIFEVMLDETTNWRAEHRQLLATAYARAPHRDEMLALVDGVLARPQPNLAALAEDSMLALARYFGLEAGRRFLRSSTLGVEGSSTQRLVDICGRLDAGTYLTGHGARHYMEHEQFERRGMAVSYIDYGLRAYEQFYGEFTPYVTALDLVAHCGHAGLDLIAGTMVDWRQFTAREERRT